MTPRERLTCYARGEEVDRIPVTLLVGETAPPMYGIRVCDYYFSADHMVTVETNLARDFGLDNMGMGLGLRTLSEALGTRMKYPEHGLSYVLEPAISDYEQLDGRALVNIETDGRLPVMAEAFGRLQERFGKTHIIGTGMAGPLTTATSLIGTERFLKDMRKRPDEIHKLMRYSTDCVIKCAQDLARKLGIGVSISEPLAAGDILGIKLFREMIMPYLKETVAALGSFQTSTSMHVCGKTRDRWHDLCDLGITSFSVDNCEDLAELKRECGHRVGLVGNIAPVDVIKNGTPKEVAVAVKQCVQKAGDSPCGYTLSSGCTVPVDTPKENLIALVNAAAVYGKRARRGRYPCGIDCVQQ